MQCIQLVGELFHLSLQLQQGSNLVVKLLLLCVKHHCQCKVRLLEHVESLADLQLVIIFSGSQCLLIFGRVAT